MLRILVGSPAARCASWPLWTRRTVTSLLVACLAGFAGDSAHRAVLLSLSSGPRCPASWPVWIRRTGVSSGSSTSLSCRILRTVRRSSGDGLPQLVTPSLASTASEAVDSATLAFLLSQSLAAKKHEEQKQREEEARKVLAEWRRRRRKLNDEFMALLNLSSRSPLQQKRMEELADLADEMEASRPGTSSASSSALKKKKKKRRKRMRTSSFPGTTSWCLVVG